MNMDDRYESFDDTEFFREEIEPLLNEIMGKVDGREMSLAFQACYKITVTGEGGDSSAEIGVATGISGLGSHIPDSVLAAHLLQRDRSKFSDGMAGFILSRGDLSVLGGEKVK